MKKYGKNILISIVSFLLVMNIASSSYKKVNKESETTSTSITKLILLKEELEMLKNECLSEEDQTILDSYISETNYLEFINNLDIVKDKDFKTKKEPKRVIRPVRVHIKKPYKEVTIEDMIDYTLIKFDLTREEYDILVAGIISEGKGGKEDADRINEALNVASALYNRCKDSRWCDYVRNIMGIKGKVGLFEHFTAKSQFDVWTYGTYTKNINCTSGPLYESIVKFLYYVDNIDKDRQSSIYGKPRHNYCSFCTSTLDRRSHNPVILVKGGNQYYDPIRPEENIPLEDTFFYQNMLEVMESDVEEKGMQISFKSSNIK